MSEQEIADNYDPVTDKDLSSYNDDTANHFARFQLIPDVVVLKQYYNCLLYTSPSPRDRQKSRMPSSA
jgi:multiple sugar transport system permease protein